MAASGSRTSKGRWAESETDQGKRGPDRICAWVSLLESHSEPRYLQLVHHCTRSCSADSPDIVLCPVPRHLKAGHSELCRVGHSFHRPIATKWPFLIPQPHLTPRVSHSSTET